MLLMELEHLFNKSDLLQLCMLYRGDSAHNVACTHSLVKCVPISTMAYIAILVPTLRSVVDPDQLCMSVLILTN